MPTTDALTDAFTRAAEPFRRELVAHCYRMLGSVHDAEDLVQETYLRAWRGYEEFAGRSSMRTWLYRIATNACLTALRQRGRRALPADLSAGASVVDWLQPLPTDPATVAEDRESLRLALVASLQLLPPRQRAVLLRRDVLAWPAEVADLLDTSVAAVKSTLQRARARLAQVTPDAVTEPPSREARELLGRYIAAFEHSDAALLSRLLHRDATLEMPASRTHGEDALRGAVAGLGSPGDWRMLPVTANAQPAAAVYLRGTAYGIVVLTPAGERIARITVFADRACSRCSAYPRWRERWSTPRTP
ncbi:RNA polymerase subunit sigma-70 [Actinophytocola sp.]|uniref:RNA polymerase subunit sigma-70 n=1 Tax=Actinophytocola sp. TaxID=1872138 RepID=UPI0025C4DBE5|nr:RNA polymerase subunit sigma-70 [Actinophytocola sp.]